MSRLLSLAAAAVFFVATPAFAQTNAADAPPSRAEIKSNLDARFKAIDSNGDGSLGKAEIDAANAKVAAQAAEALSKRLDGEFARLDADKNGQLSPTEFKSAAPDAKPTPAGTTIERLDKNKDGKIGFDEFGGNMLEAFDQLDSNKDGKLSQQEQQAARR